MKKVNTNLNEVLVSAQDAGFEARQLTGVDIRAGIDTAMLALSEAFTELEQRVMGDDGKLRPLPVDGTDVDPTQVQIVNRHRFLMKRVGQSLVDQLAVSLAFNQRRAVDQAAKLAGMRRAFESGRSTLTELSIAGTEGILDRIEEDVAILTCALKQAAISFEQVVGEPWQSLEERAAIKAARDAVTAADKKEADAKLARFA